MSAFVLPALFTDGFGRRHAISAAVLQSDLRACNPISQHAIKGKVRDGSAGLLNSMRNANLSCCLLAAWLAPAADAALVAAHTAPALRAASGHRACASSIHCSLDVKPGSGLSYKTGSPLLVPLAVQQAFDAIAVKGVLPREKLQEVLDEYGIR